MSAAHPTPAEQDLADAKRHGFSRLPAATQRRLMTAADPLALLDLLAANPKYAAGDVVGVNSPKFAGVRFEVKRINPTTYTLDPVAGGRGLRAPFDMVCADPAAQLGVPGPAVPEPVYAPPALMSPARSSGTPAPTGSPA